MKILFVCSANKQRSKTAEDYFSEKYSAYEFLSAGTNLKLCFQEGTCPLTEDLLQWAEVVYVMEQRHLNWITQAYGNTYFSKIQVLHIPDRYGYAEKALVDLLEEKVVF